MRLAWLIPALLAPCAALADYPGQDPNWPCQQPLVRELTAGSYWPGPIQANPGWRDDEPLFAAVTDIVDRNTPDDEAIRKLDAYVATIPAGKRATALPALFSAIVDQTNDVRTPLLNRIEQLGLRQRRMGDVVAAISTKVDQTPPADPHYAEFAGERDFDVRAFQETQHTMRYVCEAPANMERRLGEVARDLQEKLKAGPR